MDRINHKTQNGLGRFTSFPRLNPNFITEVDFSGKIDCSNPAKEKSTSFKMDTLPKKFTGKTDFELLPPGAARQVAEIKHGKWFAGDSIDLCE